MPDNSGETSRAATVLSHLGSMVAVAAILGIVTAGLAIPFAAVVGLTASSVADSLNELPDELETEALPQRTTILASDGTLLATLYEENRVNVPLTEVSRTMRQAILAIEDYRFYEHGALDVKGTLRAFVTNQASGETRQGGSSITQQMVKLTLLSQAKTDEERRAAQEETFARKIRELKYAIGFEKNYSKDWILERYLNLAYFGDGVYGVQAAAEHYFSKDAADLDLRESATLAGLVKNPVGYDPTTFPDRALARRNIVLDRMAQLQVVSVQDANEVKDQALGLKITPNRNGCLFSPAPFFCDYVINYLKADPALGETRDERTKLITTGGLTIHTTIDLRFQEAADESVAKRVYADEQAVGALALVEPRTGAVKALAQSRPMGTDKEKGETFINYTVPKEVGGARGFQAGSTFKVFVLAEAINQKIPLNTRINSPSPMRFNERDFETCEGDRYGSGTFSVPNSTRSGVMDLYTGTRLSVNTFFIQLEQMTGMCKPFQLAQELGVNLTNPNGDEGGAAELVPNFTLGVADATPLEMAEAYATFAGRGLHCDSRPVTTIEDIRGTLVKEYEPQCQQVLAASVADAVNDVLRGVNEPGGFGHSNNIQPRQPSAGKTGTTNSANSVWFVGYTPNLSGASMIAGANSNGSPSSLIGKKVGGRTLYSASGSGTAGPMWGDAFKAVEQWLDDEDFVKPDPTDITGIPKAVPNVNGQSVDAARKALEEAGFKVQVGGQRASGYRRGAVAFTNPSGGGNAPSGSVITIYTSTGTPPPPPPSDDDEDDDDAGDDDDASPSPPGDDDDNRDRGRGNRGGGNRGGGGNGGGGGGGGR
ncbi:penicillin-binding protein [Nocardioides sp. AE5]|uniref:penicillin-binding protein n=1 Tax=Nocardioides sp. AE5 TaxID=2962573 RepID=UPI0028816839|nr:penicillin-binding protein [Nocardioides sp. AE5]MDT0200515.1 penicillin-binding protein [Nocardioides sp. AE5]